MAHWKPSDAFATAGKLAERVLVAGATVKLASLKSSPELNGRQGKLVQYMASMGTLAEFLNSNELDCSAEKWQVQLDPVASGLSGSFEAKTIVAKASNLAYVSGPAGAEDENWWTSPLEDEEAAKMLQQRRGDGEGGGARFPSGEGGGAGDSGGTGAGLGGRAGLVGLSKEDAEHVILVRGAVELQVRDVVKMHSLQTAEAFNGLFGTLMQWVGDAERWAVQLQKTPGKVIIIRADNLMFVRERKAKPLPEQ
jgi:hypothetical protein